MAGIFSRIANLWRGFVSLWISDVEKKHPEIAYENAISSMVAKYVKLKQATAAIIRRRDDVSERLKVKSKELEQVNHDLRVAVETNQEDLGMVLIQKQQAVGAEVAELKGDLESSVRDADSAKASLMQDLIRISVKISLTRKWRQIHRFSRQLEPGPLSAVEEVSADRMILRLR